MFTPKTVFYMINPCLLKTNFVLKCCIMDFGTIKMMLDSFVYRLSVFCIFWKEVSTATTIILTTFGGFCSSLNIFDMFIVSPD